MDLLLLHGALGDAAQFENMLTDLNEGKRVIGTDFSGHGSKADDTIVFSMDVFINDIHQQMLHYNKDKISILGYSMGGYVAMYFAYLYPEKVEKVVTIGTRYVWTAEIAAREIKMLDADKMALKIPAFAQTLQKRHGTYNWKRVVENTAQFLLQLGNHNYLNEEILQQIKVPTLLISGDRDVMAPLEDTVSTYRLLQQGSLAVLPNTVHAIESIDNLQLCNAIKNYLK